MTLEQQRIKSFMKNFGQDTPEKPTQIDKETAKLRASLMLEECFETIVKGLGLKVFIDDGKDCVGIDFANLKDIKLYYEKDKEVDLVEVADGVADILVTSLGTSVACGIDQEEINIDVFDSNDSKLHKASELESIPENCSVKEIREGLFIVKRADGKVVKPNSYVEANPGKFIQEQINN